MQCIAGSRRQRATASAPAKGPERHAVEGKSPRIKGKETRKIAWNYCPAPPALIGLASQGLPPTPPIFLFETNSFLLCDNFLATNAGRW